MSETRYLPAAQTPASVEAGGAIVPVVPASITEYARDVYLALPKERQDKKTWAELAALAARSDWENLEAIHHHFSALTISDNSTHSHTHFQSSNCYEDNRAVSYADDRQWHEHHQLDYADDRRWIDNSVDYQYQDESQFHEDNRSWIAHDDRQWHKHHQLDYADSRQWIDNSSSSYAPEHHYYVDNSIYLSVDVSGSFNGNGSGNSSHSSSSSVSSGSSGGEFDPIKYVLFIFSVGLATILAAGMWQNASVNLPPRYSPVEVR